MKQFEQVKAENGIEFICDDTQGCERSLRTAWEFFFKFFVTSNKSKFLTPFHESHQCLDEKVSKFSLSKPSIKGKEYRVHRPWVWDDVLKKWCTTVTIYNTLSTDSFAGPYPEPQKTFVQCFQHIFNKGLDQFCCCFCLISLFFWLILCLVYVFIFFRTPLLSISLLLKGGVKDDSDFMIDKYLWFSQQMQQMSAVPFRVSINDTFDYLIQCRWFWICDAPAKHALCGWSTLSSKYAVLPQIKFFNLRVFDEEVSFITKDTWAALLYVQARFTPIEYKEKKASNSLPDYPYAVLLDDELNKEHSDLINEDMEFLNVTGSRSEQHEARFEASTNRHQPQVTQAVPFSLNPILSILHMHKTVTSRACDEIFNYYLRDAKVPYHIFEQYFKEISEGNVFKKLLLWKKKNIKETLEDGINIYTLKENSKKFTFGNVNKRQAFKMFCNCFEFIVLMDGFCTEEKHHFYSAFALVIRVRIAQSIRIYLRSDFSDNEESYLTQIRNQNEIMLRLILTFFPDTVIFLLFVCLCVV